MAVMVDGSGIAHFQRGRDINTAANSAGNWTKIGVEAKHSFGSFAFVRGDFEMIGHMDTLDHQNVAILLDLAACFRGQKTGAGRNLARFQRAAKGARQSAGRGGYHIVEGRGVGFVNLGINAIMCGDLGMDSKKDGPIFLGEIGAPHCPFYPLDTHL
jgi:hypothetical protein